MARKLLSSVRMTRLNVAHVVRKLDPQAWGGTETHVRALTRAMEADGVDSVLYAPNLDAAGSEVKFSPRIRIDRYRAFAPFLGSESKRRALVSNAGNIASLELPAKLMRDAGAHMAHLHTAGRIGGAVRTAMRLSGRPYVVSVHGPVASQSAWLKSETQKRYDGVIDLGRPLGALLGARAVLADATFIIVFNEDERAALSAKYGDRVVRLDQGVDAHRYAHGTRTAACKRFPQLAGRKVITVVGRLCGQKNQVFATEILTRLRDDSCVLALAGAETDVASAQNIDAAAARFGVRDRVFKLGNLDARAVADLYATSDLLLVPSLQETFGLVALEAWAAGVPTLVAHTGGLGDLADATGISELSVRGYDALEWARRADAILSSERLRQEMNARTRRLVSDRYAWSAVAKAHRELYERALGVCSPRAARSA